MNAKYIPVIGLEVHIQLLTKSKIFASDETSFGAAPNSQVSPITLAHPGTLPRLNKKAVEMGIRMGLACHCALAKRMMFDRKNYFYPDLPKGYQITQDHSPLGRGGFIVITAGKEEKKIPLNRIHLEEDAGKSIHADNGDTLIDLNRAGVPLIELVTEPALRSAEEASALLAEIRQMVRYLGICDGNMEEGSLRCDANVSLMPEGATVLGKKAEIKNLNSIRYVQRAIAGEIKRQEAILRAGQEVTSDTRLYNAEKDRTISMRTKEELNDYRYFPDPDISPIEISEEWINAIAATQPVLARELKAKFKEKYQLPDNDCNVLTETKEMASFFEETCRHTKNFKAVSNWLMGPIKNRMNEMRLDIAQLKMAPAALAEMTELIESGKINFGMAAQHLLPALSEYKGSAAALAEKLNIAQENNISGLESVIEDIIREFPLKVEEYKKGKKAIVGMFMGEAMKRLKGKADPKAANETIVSKLDAIK